MKRVVFVDGQEGTTGLRIHEVLAQRKDIELLKIDPAKRKDAAERARLLNAADVAFLCLPDGPAREAAALVTNPRTCVIDASTAHRTVAGWTYGLPEVAPDQRDKLRESKRIGNPGCHATAFVLLVRPLVDAGLLAPSAALSATSITGYSGGGKKMIEQYEAGPNARLDAPQPYGLTLSHKHIPEMMVHTGLARKPVFMPVVGRFYKGLAVSVPLHLSQLGGGATAQALQDCLGHATPASASCASCRWPTRRPWRTASSTCRRAMTPTGLTSSSSPTTSRRCSCAGSTTSARARAARRCSA
jgi:N-acetyl-gamma-glutamyl-phosphate reductase